MRRISVAAVAAAVALTIVVTGPGAAAAPVLPDGLEVRFGEGVSAQTRWYVDAAVDRAWSYFAPLLDAPEEFAATVVVVTSADDAAGEWASERGVSKDRARRMFTARSGSYAGLATTGLTVIINDNTGAPGATLHEFVHLIQHEFAGPTQGPRWISEGSAKYFDMLIAHEWGIDAEAQAPRAANRTIADEWSATVRNCRAGLLPDEAETCRWAEASLETLEPAGPFDVGGGAVSAYHRASVAFQHLIDESSVEAYLCFLEAQGTGRSWRAAFGDCFEMDIGDFYALFDQSRERGFIGAAVARTPLML